jgi:hypothetical protein
MAFGSQIILCSIRHFKHIKENDLFLTNQSPIALSTSAASSRQHALHNSNFGTGRSLGSQVINNGGPSTEVIER